MCAKTSRGFTLLEAVVALAILGAVSAAALAAVSTELRTTERTTRAVAAAALSQNQLARLQLLPAQQLAALPDSLRSGTFVPPFADYRWSATTRNVRGEQDLYELTMLVEWDDGEFQLVSRLHRPNRAVSEP